MSLSKKHFEAIAKVMKYNKPFNEKEKYVWDKITLGLANYFETQNNNFNCNRFLKACEGD